MATQQPRVSVVISAYNAAAYLGEAIESVLAQTRPADEIVVVDDGSTDATATVARGYANRGVRLVQQPNQGAGASRNRGIRETSGELLAFLDGDDLWLPQKLERQLAYLAAHPEAALVSCIRWHWSQASDERHIEYFGVRPGRSLRHENVVRNVVGNPSMTLIRRAVLDVVGGFDTSLRWGQDWELFMRIAEHGPIGFVNEPLMVYRWHPGGLSHERGIRRLDMFQGIALRGIARTRPRWRRPILLARRFSWDQFDRAVFAERLGLSRRRQLRHALLGLLIFPFERPASKLKRCLRAAVGGQRYAELKADSRMVALRTRQAESAQGGGQ